MDSRLPKHPRDQPHPPIHVSYLNTASFFTNYGKLPFVEYSVVKDQTGGISPLAKLAARERFPPNPLGSLTRGAPKPHAVRSPFKDQPGHPLPAEARGASDLVENTGLEPVTSWLQTRRSPS